MAAIISPLGTMHNIWVSEIRCALVFRHGKQKSEIKVWIIYISDLVSILGNLHLILRTYVQIVGIVFVVPYVFETF